ncbi:HlyD family efflux transporter periplasmic adaptor subunit [Peptoniphilus lacydonensis]|uniref:HlyD family efflux transporter periplasmic adaptor subunit n=1 Tax=Peptoniphilus lacydonensis TaxID=1673725 RepID=UPI0037367348
MNNNLKKNKNSKKNKFLRRRLFALLIFLLLLMFFTNLIRANRVNNYKTIFPTLTTYEKDIDTKIYNLFEEKAYFAKGDGIAVFHTSEGQKVPLGYEVANLNLMEDVSSLKDELNKVNSAIKIKNGIEPHEKENPKSFTKNIQDSIKNEDYQNLYFDINSPDNDFNPNLNESELKEYLEMPKENLLNKKSDLENKISKYNYSYLAEFSGIVSYKIDGNEKHFKLDNLDKFTYKYLNKNYDFKNIEMETQVKKGDPLFKIINNLNWKLACTIIDVSQISNYNIGDSVKIQIPDMQDIYGRVERINKDSNHAVIIVNLDRYFENMYSNRIHEGKIIVNKTKVFEIPKSTLIERNNLIGVYVEEIKGLVKFVPVDIISESNESVFINKGNKQSVINIGEKSYQTVTVNDALVINPKTVDESRILN